MTQSFVRPLAGLVLLSSLATGARAAGNHISVQPFGTVNGQSVSLYTLTNTHGMRVQITNYGGIVTSIMVPDRKGKFDDVVLGYDNVNGYVKNSPYFGALVGRYANRIAKGRFTLDGKAYKLAINNPPNSLHGGLKGFDKRIWQADMMRRPVGVGLLLRYVSRNMEEGFPGTLSTRVIYTLTNTNELIINYHATTDRDTVVNLTNHSYFNLAGAGNGDVLKHRVMINANRFTPIDKNLIPTGKLQSVAGTPLDFRRETAIGARINSKYVQIQRANGYDHNFVLNHSDSSLLHAARVSEPTTGRVLDVFTTQPGIQLYTGNFLDGKAIGKGDKPYKFRYAFCLETQHFPDSPNQPNFPTTKLRPGQVYQQVTIYKFSTQ